jgi:hypothetical protein
MDIAGFRPTVSEHYGRDDIFASSYLCTRSGGVKSSLSNLNALSKLIMTVKWEPRLRPHGRATKQTVQHRRTLFFFLTFILSSSLNLYVKKRKEKKQSSASAVATRLRPPCESFLVSPSPSRGLVRVANLYSILLLQRWPCCYKVFSCCCYYSTIPRFFKMRVTTVFSSSTW